jgi:hypothetical protein
MPGGEGIIKTFWRWDRLAFWDYSLSPLFIAFKALIDSSRSALLMHAAGLHSVGIRQDLSIR